MYCLRGASLETALLTKSLRTDRRSLATTRTLHNSHPSNFPPVRFAPSVAQPTLQAGWRDQSRAVRWTTLLVVAASLTIGVDHLRHLRDIDLAFLDLTGKEGITMPRKKCLKSSDPQETLSLTVTLPWPGDSMTRLGFPDPMAYLRPPFTLREDDEKVVCAQEVFDRLLQANKLTNLGLRIKIVDTPGLSSQKARYLRW